MKPTDLSQLAVVTGFGSVCGTPYLPAAFAGTFTSYLVDTGKLRLHAVIGGKGPPLLLLGGWPQCWYAWRELMLPLAEKFTVIAADPRGVNVSDKPAGGYDGDTLAQDMFDLMSALGHEKFAMVGHDIGMWTGYAMAVDHPRRITRVALGEAIVPGVSPSIPLLVENRQISDIMWHFNFNRAHDINERLVEGREEIYFGYQFDTKSGPVGVPSYAREFYIEILRRVPGALKASFEYYRALDQSIQQYHRRASKKIAVPMLAFSGDLSCGDWVEKEMRSVANDVQSIIIADCGHFPAEEKPEELLNALLQFLIY
ncbi:alpha/beta hydrolase [Burkholderia cenocepacia]|uniref:alpha/beta fold hydrolase n=1 Tax=Burkholderia cenocepacia TaxID=95486 RepID=UPI00196B9E7F|nr:alpha/beta hydrolase [Burkholderia cenocepacia]MBN3534168.1 alpha/beta hydrolase [Burkholderia cenocepacia]MBR8029963.1 alpha/beta hydrolase [Burkholderia cenocepacia]MBR8173788.1 alpha/beta hydrolase [Burkholderia cenocepacia]MBR8429066.1 alpha/beta hydrolase [Burkholderia cenocepacia]MBU9659633.1 alpha/beta hydrolase [Burkholderia cenocepacia]